MVVLWGAGVRATGSGAGCGDQWPLCKGGWLPSAPRLQTVIEFTHRLTSGPALGLLVIGLVAFAFRAFPRRHVVRRFATLSLLFTASEAFIGAALVLLGHVGTNATPDRAYTLAVHLVNTMILLAVLALTAAFATSSANANVEPCLAQPVSRALSICALVAFLMISVTGVIAALGDTLFPARSLAEGVRQDLSASAHIFVRLRAWHPVAAALLGAFLVAFAIRSVTHKGSSPIVRRLGLGVAALTIMQACLGAINVVLLAPVWMQLAHLLVADLLWIALVLLSAWTIRFGRPASRVRVDGMEALV